MTIRIRRRDRREPIEDVDVTELLTESKTEAGGANPPATAGWSRVLRGNRLLWIVAGASVVCLVAGYTGGSLISSAGAAETPGKGGPITVPIESRVLSNTVKLRGDAGFDDPVDVKVAAGELEGPAVVTGTVPEVGATLDALSVALEVAGRPVIVLPGALPAYRTLRAGQKGPDVAQLKVALRAVGFDPGDSDEYDSSTANAVTALYQKVGYAPPSAGVEAKAAVESAEQAVDSAETSLESAQRDLAAAGKGADAAKRVELENAVREAEREIAAARASGDGAAIARAEDALRLAQTQLSVGLSAPDTSSENGAVNSARQALQRAQSDLAKANEGALTPLPANEVQFLPTLPRRVDEVSTARGKVLEGTAMVVSGATLAVTARAGAADAELLKSGLAASVELPDGSDLAASVTSVKPRKAEDGEDKKAGTTWDVALALTSPTPKQVEQLRGQNVRVSIPVKATKGKVLVVPSAALTAGPGGDSRVEIARGDSTRVVPVKTGLAADGLVEVSGSISAGDRVVVGR